MEKTLIVLASRTKGKVFEAEGRSVSKRPVLELNNPDGSLKEGDLVSDRPGRATHIRNTQRSPMPNRQPQTERLLERFAGELAEGVAALNPARVLNIILVAEPRALGQFRAALSAHKYLQIVAEVHSELVIESDHEIVAKL